VVVRGAALDVGLCVPCFSCTHIYIICMHINRSIYAYTYGQRVRAPGVGLQLPRRAGRLLRRGREGRRGLYIYTHIYTFCMYIYRYVYTYMARRDAHHRAAAPKLGRAPIETR